MRGASSRIRRFHRADIPRLALAAAVAAGGCDRAGGTGPRAEVRDSAGIRIVTSSAPRWPAAAALRLADSPSLTIGVAEGAPEYELHDAYSGTRLSDGRIVIANRGTHELRYYDAQGRFQRSAGRQGSGPGEFAYLSRVDRWPGDSVVATDAVNPVLSFFDPAGRFARAVRLGQVAGARPRFAATLPDRTLLARVSVGTRPRDATLVQDTSLLVRIDPARSRVDTIGRFAGAVEYRQFDTEGRAASWAQPFGPSTPVAAGGGRVYVGDPATGRILVFEPAGRLRAIFRGPPPRAVTEDDIRRFREAGFERAASEELRRVYARAYDEMPFAEVIPTFDQLFADERGTVWAREFPLPWESAPQRWNVFQPNGAWLGTVEVPQQLFVLEIGAEYVLGTHVGEDGVQQVRLYSLTDS
jgi:hypothetical protein